MKPVTCINVARETGHAVLSLDGAEYAVSLDDLQKILADIAGTRPAPATELLRPSLLPKLAQCPCYVSSPDAGEAARRGTRMDAAFRALLMGVDEFRACEHLKADEKESILWAVKTVRTLCSGEEVIADKNRCAFPQWHPRVTGGEADCLCPALGKLFDLKSGQIRNYWEQQASYAKSFMEREFLDEITCHLLYCDQQQIVTRKFTYREAISIVNGVVDAVDRGGGPRLCWKKASPKSRKTLPGWRNSSPRRLCWKVTSKREKKKSSTTSTTERKSPDSGASPGKARTPSLRKTSPNTPPGLACRNS